MKQSGLCQGPDHSELLEKVGSHQVLIPNEEEVCAYLAKFPKLAELLPQICGQVREAFGQDGELSLELYRDLEIDDRYLTLYFRQDKYDAHIMERIEAVSQEFNPKLELVPGYFLLTTDFRRPRDKNAV